MLPENAVIQKKKKFKALLINYNFFSVVLSYNTNEKTSFIEIMLNTNNYPGSLTMKLNNDDLKSIYLTNSNIG